MGNKEKLQLFIDSNIYIQLYEVNKISIDELVKIKDRINEGRLQLYFPDLVKSELYRHKQHKISSVIRQCEDFRKNQLSIPMAFNCYDAFKLITKLHRELKEAVKVFCEEIKTNEKDEKLPIDTLLNELITKSNLPLSEKQESEIYKKSQFRKSKRLPPGKTGKNESIGDEWNWEYLLECVPCGNDIYIITDDKDFYINEDKSIPNPLLLSEWRKKKDGECCIYKSLAVFFSRHSELKIRLPRESVLALSKSKSFSVTHAAIEKLDKVFDNLTKEEATYLLQALISNDQIYEIVCDSDIRSFYERLLQKFKHEFTDKSLVKDAKTILEKRND